MIEWVVVAVPRGGKRPATDVVVERLGRAWSGGARLGWAELGPRVNPCLLLAPDGATPRRAPRFADVLTDWADIYEEPLGHSALVAVAAEAISEGGQDVLALVADLGDPEGPRAAAGWYDKGALVELEQVGKASVAWRTGGELGRPAAGDVTSALASAARHVSDDSVFDRIEKGRDAAAEAILLRAMRRALAADPPPLRELLALGDRVLRTAVAL